jgi:(p)ppGpp synthase/HD superfamily hydrolase
MNNMTEETIQIKAEKWASKSHSSTNHFYNDMPYRFHLEMVVGYAEKYLDLVPEHLQDTVLAACWAHDLIEDCRKTYNDVRGVLGIEVAEIVYALTNEKGKNRKDRANKAYYEGIRNAKGAIFVKLCDRLANIKYSVEHGSKMADAYRREHMNFLSELYKSQYDPMYKELQDLLTIEPNVQECDATKLPNEQNDGLIK